MPANFLVSRKGYYDAGYCNPITQFETTPGYFNADAITVYLWYGALVDETEFPQYFIEYFKYKLALELSFNFTGDSQLLTYLAEQEKRQNIKARNTDAKQIESRTIKASPFTAIRR